MRRPSLRGAALLALAVALAGCGGGGGSASRPPSPAARSTATEIAASEPAPPPGSSATATPTAGPATTATATTPDSPGASADPSAPSAGLEATTAAARPLVGRPPIIRSYLPFPQRRKNETRAYSVEHYGIDTYRLTDPHLVIWHFTETTDYQSVFNTFASDVPDVEFHELPQVCAHFVVDTDGTIHQLVPLGIICRHVVGLNYTALGIEMVGLSDQQVLGDTAEYHAAVALTRWLRCRSHIPVHDVIGHNESLQSPYYRELVPAFRGQTHDDFKRADMRIVRARLATLPCRA